MVMNESAGGRPRVTTAARLGRVAMQLFMDQGFEATTMDNVAAAGGVGRRTVFRYFASKNDLPWGDYAAELVRLRHLLTSAPREVDTLSVLSAAMVEMNTVGAEE